MTTEALTYYTLKCDYPGCEVRSGDNGDYSAWSDVGQAQEDADNGEWLTDFFGSDYCPDHCYYDASRDAMLPMDPLDVGQAVLKVFHSFDWKWKIAAERLSSRLERRR